MNYVNQHDFYLETNGKIIDIDGVYGGQCFTEDHYITMEDGSYKKISELQAGDKVLSKNMQEVNMVEYVTKRKTKVIKLKTHYNDFKVTKEHPFFDINGKIGKAMDINKDTKLSMPIVNNKKNFNLTINELKWLGFWLGDGHIIRYQNRKKNYGRKDNYAITVSKEKNRYINTLNFEKNGYEHSSNKNTYIYELTRRKHKELYKALKHCHFINGEKTLPHLFTKEQYKYIIDGYYEADKLSSTSLSLLLGIQYGCFLNNLEMSIHLKKDKEGRKLYQGYIAKKIKRYFRVNECTEDIVYNLSVTGDNTYICNNTAVHNCWDLFAYYCQKLCGRTFPCIETGYVIDLWNTFEIIGLNEYFVKVYDNYQDGDWLVYKAPSSITSSSHIAMFRLDNKNNTNVILTQNPNGNPNYTHQMVGDYSGVIGALRPKIYLPKEKILAPSPIEKDTTIDQVLVKAGNTVYCRTSPDNTIENKVDDYFVKVGYYNILSETDFNNYHWYEIAKDRWIAQVDGYVEYCANLNSINNDSIPPLNKNSQKKLRQIFNFIRNIIIKIIKFFSAK